MERAKNAYWMGEKGKAGDDDKSSNKSVETVSNHIYFYTSIDDDSSLNLNKTIKSTTSTIRKQTLELEVAETDLRIYLHINSPGGSLFDSLSVLDTVINNPIPIITIVEGAACSGATLFSIAGKERWIYRHSYMLIHQLRAFFGGKYDEFGDEMRNLDKYMEMIEKVYQEYTKIPVEKLREILKHDLFFDATQCQEYGLVDKII